MRRDLLDRDAGALVSSALADPVEQARGNTHFEEIVPGVIDGKPLVGEVLGQRLGESCGERLDLGPREPSLLDEQLETDGGVEVCVGEPVCHLLEGVVVEQ